jgi:hypothetical protein
MISIKNIIKKEISGINKEVKNKIAGYMITAFSLVAGLAWNDAIKSFIEYYFPLEKNSLLAKFLYALAFTMLVVLVSVYIVRILKSQEKEKNNK